MISSRTSSKGRSEGAATDAVVGAVAGPVAGAVAGCVVVGVHRVEGLPSGDLNVLELHAIGQLIGKAKRVFSRSLRIPGQYILELIVKRLHLLSGGGGRGG